MRVKADRVDSNYWLSMGCQVRYANVYLPELVIRLACLSALSPGQGEAVFAPAKPFAPSEVPQTQDLQAKVRPSTTSNDD